MGKGQESKKIVNDPKDINSLSTNHINTIECDKKGSLWIGTIDDGVNVFDPVKNKFTRYSPSNKNNPGIR